MRTTLIKSITLNNQLNGVDLNFEKKKSIRRSGGEKKNLIAAQIHLLWGKICSENKQSNTDQSKETS